MAVGDSGSTLAGRRLAAHLRDARQAVKLTIAQAAVAADISTSVLQRLETADRTRLKARDLEALCQIYEMPDEQIKAMIGLLLKAGEKSWWHAYGDVIPANFDVYIGLEADAYRIAVYQPSIVPGLLQTPEYALTLVENAFPERSDEEHKRLLAFRMERQVRITRRHKPIDLLVILNETVLRCKVGDDAVMAAQLRHLAEVGKRPNVSVCVLPFAAGIPVGNPIGHYAMLEFEDPTSPPVIHVESFTGSMYLEKPTEVSQYVEVTRRLQRHTLGEDVSRSLLRKMVKEFER
ncbi:helix-turn-helix domain-containing protein [Nocardia sp. NPDC057353]|uniref:helix-turn-helix domain-containing protein n=1 Tax=Nocardia sp. NPDC057353 TaxID=3346104 RepID=UPI003637565F